MPLITESWRTAIGQGYILPALALEIYGFNIRMPFSRFLRTQIPLNLSKGLECHLFLIKAEYY
jgi:hypothetical protein